MDVNFVCREIRLTRISLRDINAPLFVSTTKNIHIRKSKRTSSSVVAQFSLALAKRFEFYYTHYIFAMISGI
jgi:hypothetical protein